MCSEIDERTRENPEAAMVHHNEINRYANALPGAGYYEPLYQQIAYDPQKSGLNFTPEFLHQIAEGQKAREKEPWPWPKSPPEPQHFDGDAHRAFLKEHFG